MATSERGRIRVTIKRLRHDSGTTSRRPRRSSEPAFAEPLNSLVSSIERWSKLKIIFLWVLPLFLQRATSQRLRVQGR